MISLERETRCSVVSYFTPTSSRLVCVGLQRQLCISRKTSAVLWWWYFLLGRNRTCGGERIQFQQGLDLTKHTRHKPRNFCRALIESAPSTLCLERSPAHGVGQVPPPLPPLSARKKSHHVLLSSSDAKNTVFLSEFGEWIT